MLLFIVVSNIFFVVVFNFVDDFVVSNDVVVVSNVVNVIVSNVVVYCCL